MFWKKKPKSPITQEDEDFVRESFAWILNNFGNEILTSPLLTPSDFRFDPSEEGVYQIFSSLCNYMNVRNDKIKLLFYNERSQLDFGDSLITQYDERTELTLGKYKQYSNGEVEIWIERNLIQNPESLVATIAHELSHFKLLYEKKLSQNDEFLTDFLTIFYGLGLFGANSSVIRMNTWGSGSASGWQVHGGEGYLHFKVWAFSLAYFFELKKGQNNNREHWVSFMEPDIKKSFNKSLNYLYHKK